MQVVVKTEQMSDCAQPRPGHENNTTKMTEVHLF